VRKKKDAVCSVDPRGEGDETTRVKNLQSEYDWYAFKIIREFVSEEDKALACWEKIKDLRALYHSKIVKGGKADIKGRVAKCAECGDED